MPSVNDAVERLREHEQALRDLLRRAPTGELYQQCEADWKTASLVLCVFDALSAPEAPAGDDGEKAAFPEQDYKDTICAMVEACGVDPYDKSQTDAANALYGPKVADIVRGKIAALESKLAEAQRENAELDERHDKAISYSVAVASDLNRELDRLGAGRVKPDTTTPGSDSLAVRRAVAHMEFQKSELAEKDRRIAELEQHVKDDAVTLEYRSNVIETSDARLAGCRADIEALGGKLFDNRPLEFFELLKNRAHELAKDYPFAEADNAFELLWAITSSLEGKKLAIGDWRKHCDAKDAERDSLRTEVERLKGKENYYCSVRDRLVTQMGSQSDEIARLKAELAEAKAQSGWIPVTERMPEKEDGSKFGDVFALHLDGSAGYCMWSRVQNMSTATHWMRIPALPSEPSPPIAETPEKPRKGWEKMRPDVEWPNDENFPRVSEADQDIAAGKVETFDSVDALISDLPEAVDGEECSTPYASGETPAIGDSVESVVEIPTDSPLGTIHSGTRFSVAALDLDRGKLRPLTYRIWWCPSSFRLVHREKRASPPDTVGSADSVISDSAPGVWQSGTPEAGVFDVGVLRRILEKAKRRARDHVPLSVLSQGMREFERQMAREEVAAIEKFLGIIGPAPEPETPEPSPRADRYRAGPEGVE